MITRFPSQPIPSHEHPPPHSIRNLALGDLEHEVAATRRTLERVPDEHLGWKPHEKSWNLGTLAGHLANILHWGIGILASDDLDLSTLPPPDPSRRLDSRDELLRIFDERTATLRAALGAADDRALSAKWTLRRGEQVMFVLPRAAALRAVLLSHMIHHRGQLTVYLRQVGAAVPALYGPSADEAM